MTNQEQIIEELEKNIKDKDPEEQKFLISICNEILSKESPRPVSLLLQEKVNLLKSKFDDAHSNLLKKMGL
ncbi:hypothetical protein ES703_08950 [subsurface metagenome]